MTGKQLAVELRAAGVPVTAVHERTAATDAGVELGGDLGVQIAFGRLHLNRWDGAEGAMRHLGSYATPAEAVAAIARVRCTHPAPELIDYDPEDGVERRGCRECGAVIGVRTSH